MVGIHTGQHYRRHSGLVKNSYAVGARKHAGDSASARKMNSTGQGFVPAKVDVHANYLLRVFTHGSQYFDVISKSGYLIYKFNNK